MQYINYTLKNLLSDKRIFVPSLLIAFGFLLFSPIYANAATYYFNNAVNNDPSEVGNYWNDSDAIDPALGLPDFATDEVNIIAGSTFDNDGTIYEPIAFNGLATNEGTVTGDAIFYNNQSSNSISGVISGSKTRHFNIASTSTHDYVSDGPWTIIANGVAVNLVGATVDGDTVFSAINSGSFVYVTLSSYYAYNTSIIFTYATALDTGSVPATSAYTVSVDGSSATISSVGISGSVVTLTLASALNYDDVITVTYTTPGLNPVQRATIGSDAPSFSSLSIPHTIPVGTDPLYSVLVGSKLYVVNSDSGNVSVINTTTDTISSTITVGNGPTYITALGTKLYVNNTVSDTVSVINTLTDTVSATISVGDQPFFLYPIGNKIYVNNAGGNSISIINTITDTVSTTISSVGSFPYYHAVVGSKLYISNNGGTNVSVIDLTTNTKTTTINVGTNPNFLAVVGTKVYVTNFLSDTVSVINTLTDTVSATISVGQDPYQLIPVGTKIYVSNQSDSTVSVINTATDTVSATISVGSHAYFLTLVGTEVYVTNRTGNTISVINTSTDTVTATLNTRTTPVSSNIVNNKLYVLNIGSDNLNVINVNSITSKLPALTSFSSSTASGTYISGQSINITANFDRNLLAGSTMTVTLDTGDSVVLSTVSDSTLSGTYTIGAGDTTSDLYVTAISSASVTDSTNTYTRTSYSVPSSVGSFTAENSLITRNIGDSKNIVIGNYITATTGSKPYQISVPVNGYLYVANQGAGTVSVIRISDNTLVETVTVGSEPYGLATITISSVVYVYVANTNSNTVSVIDTSNNTVVATVTVGHKPYYVAVVGTDVYVTNGGSNTVSVIDTSTNTVSDTISVGLYPRGIRAYGTDLYVSNYGDPNYSGGNYISVIDSTTNTVTDTIVLPSGSYGPRGITSLGTKVYVANYRSNNVSVINTATNTVTDTISVGTGPRGIVGLGTNIYVENFDNGTLSVIDTDTNTVSATVNVGHSPAGMSISGTYLYISNFQDDKLSVFNTTDNTLLNGTAPGAPTAVSAVAGNAQAIVSFTAPASDGGYSVTSYTVTSSPGSITASGASSPITITGLTNNISYTFTVTATNIIGTSSSSDPSSSVSPSGGGGAVIVFPPGLNSNPNKLPPTLITPNPCASRCLIPSVGIFNKTISINQRSGEVRYLQKFLNDNGFLVNNKGVGSPGRETDYFGILTKKALISFQEKYREEILTPVNLKKGTGVFGPSTKKFINSLLTE